MRDKRYIWKTDRIPTKTERWIGLVASVFICGLFFLFSYFCIVLNNFVFAFIWLLAGIYIAKIAYGFAFKEPEKLNQRAIKIVNYILLLGSFGLLLGGIFSPFSTTSVSAISVGLVGVSASINNIKSNDG